MQHFHENLCSSLDSKKLSRLSNYPDFLLTGSASVPTGPDNRRSTVPMEVYVKSGVINISAKQCLKCHEWTDETCSNAEEGDGKFICDFRN